MIGTLKFLHVLTGFWMTAGLVGRGVAQLRGDSYRFIPRGKKFGVAFEEAIATGSVTDQLSRALRDPVVRIAHIYEVVAILVIIWLMVAKPF